MSVKCLLFVKIYFDACGKISFHVLGHSTMCIWSLNLDLGIWNPHRMSCSQYILPTTAQTLENETCSFQCTRVQSVLMWSHVFWLVWNYEPRFVYLDLHIIWPLSHSCICMEQTWVKTDLLTPMKAGSFSTNGYKRLPFESSHNSCRLSKGLFHAVQFWLFCKCVKKSCTLLFTGQ